MWSTDFTIDKNRKTGKVVEYTVRRKAVPDFVVKKIAPIYETILGIEKLKGFKASEQYFKSLLVEQKR